MEDQSDLPPELEQPTVEKMHMDEVAYVVPWSMKATVDRRLWIDICTPMFKSPCGTAHMRIKRVSDGFIVDPSTIGDQRYTPNYPRNAAFDRPVRLEAIVP